MTQTHAETRATSAPQRSLPGRLPIGALVLMLGLAVATLALAILTNGNVAAALAPGLGFMAVHLLRRLPLRYIWYGYIALVMLLDSPTEGFASGRYASPFLPLAQLLTMQLKIVTHINALVMSGLDVLIVGTLLMHVARRLQESPLDREGYLPTPLPLLAASWLCLLGVAFATVWGIATGGQFRFALWQIQRNIYLPLVLLVAHAIFPSGAHLKSFMKLLTGVACIRAVTAIWLRFKFPDVEYTTCHSDSILFAGVTCYMLVRLLHGTTLREKKLLLPMLALVGWGMVANDRRLVWVEIGVALLFAYFMSPWTLLKRRIAQLTLGSIPVTLAYIAVGWQSSAGIFKPVQILRSMADSKSDGSTLWRDLENFNLVTTFSQHPVIGSGFGHPYVLAVAMPDITAAYELEPYVPHNSVVGLWAYTGYLGFSLLWALPLVGAFICARTYYAAKEKDDRIMALMGFCSVVIYLLQCYGDMGLGTAISFLMLGPIFVMIGKRAIAIGAWPRFGRPRPYTAPTVEATGSSV